MIGHQANRIKRAANACICERIAEPEAGVPELQLSVSLSVSPGDHTILVANIDRTESQPKIISDLRQELSEFGVPYRRVDKRVLEAIRKKLAENITYREAAIYTFGDANYARKIRYWQNRWQVR